MTEVDAIIATIFQCSADDLKDEDTPETIKAWDSMAHIILLSALEEEFSISFSETEMAAIKTVGDIRQQVAAKRGS